MHRLFAVFAATAFVFMSAATPALAENKLTILAKLVHGDTEIDIATYGDASNPDMQLRVGLVGIRQGTRRNSAAFDAHDWPQFLALWRSAERMNSGTWTLIGQFVETGTSDVSTLRISSGPGYRFVIESPAKGAFNAEAPRSDAAAIDAADAEVSSFLGVPQS